MRRLCSHFVFKQLVHSAVWPPGWGCRLGACRQVLLRRCPGSVILVCEARGVSFFSSGPQVFSSVGQKEFFAGVFTTTAHLFAHWTALGSFFSLPIGFANYSPHPNCPLFGWSSSQHSGPLIITPPLQFPGLTVFSVKAFPSQKMRFCL